MQMYTCTCMYEGLCVSPSNRANSYVESGGGDDVGVVRH